MVFYFASIFIEGNRRRLATSKEGNVACSTAKDIYKAYKTHDFHGDPETEKTIKSIGKIFQRQEMQIKAVIPER